MKGVLLSRKRQIVIVWVEIFRIFAWKIPFFSSWGDCGFRTLAFDWSLFFLMASVLIFLTPSRSRKKIRKRIEFQWLAYYYYFFRFARWSAVGTKMHQNAHQGLKGLKGWDQIAQCSANTSRRCYAANRVWPGKGPAFDGDYRRWMAKLGVSRVS